MEKVESARTEQFEQRRTIHSLLLLREMQLCQDEERQRRIYEQVCDLEASHISEVLEGETRTQFSFEIHDGKLFAIQPDGVIDWCVLHENGVARARARAERDPRFNFYKDIAEAEQAEAREQEAMVAAGEPASMFTLSLDGSDIAPRQALVDIGREPEKQKAYLRASVYDGEKLHLYSSSKNGVNLEKAKEVYRAACGLELDAAATSLDILKARVIMPGAHHDLLDRVMPPGGRNNYEFVLSQPDLLELHINSLLKLASADIAPPELAKRADNLRYDIMSSFKQRLEGKWINLGDLGESVSYAGDIERMAGTSYPGCDSTVTGANKLAEAGFVNANGSGNSLARHEFESKFCPNCLPKPKSGKKVRAWRQGDTIGCYACGREQDICTGQITRSGRKLEKKKQPDQKISELVYNGLANYWARLKEESKSKQQAAKRLPKNT